MKRVWTDVGRALNQHVSKTVSTAGGDDADAYVLTTDDGNKFFAKYASPRT